MKGRVRHRALKDEEPELCVQMRVEPVQKAEEAVDIFSVSVCNFIIKRR